MAKTPTQATTPTAGPDGSPRALLAPTGNPADQARQSRVGVAYGLAAYLWWGLVPLYFKAVSHVPPLEVLAHRVVWSLLLLWALVRIRSRWSRALAVLRDRTVLLTLVGTGALIAVNWFTFIWAVTNDRVLEAGLGYFINPLISVLLGFVFLRERLRPWQAVSVVVAAIGVGYRAIWIGHLPGVALILAFSFGFYGLIRKTARVDALVGLTFETTFLSPLALVYLVSQASTDGLYFGTHSWTTTLLLALGGMVTATPLLWFNNAARRLRLATLGFLQYLAPSLQCLLAVVAFGEPFARAQWVTFGLIWAALAIYSVDAYRATKSPRLKGP